MAAVISFDALGLQAEAHRAELYRQAAMERLAAQALAARRPLRIRLAEELRRVAERVDPGDSFLTECCASSSVQVGA
ncbi:MAG: hypothetical protein E6I75_18880 [Chloroflexi bacterium]|nr:MAG: hypothetical protein E6I75_18880 [Chloroflexota bacterium]